MKLLLKIARARFIFAALAGLLLAVSFPKWSIAGLAWVAPGLMLLAAIGKRGAQTFRIGYVAGLAHYLASLYWLLLIPVAWFPILGWAALSAFLALLPATWVWLCWKFYPAQLAADNFKNFNSLDEASSNPAAISSPSPPSGERAGVRGLPPVAQPKQTPGTTIQNWAEQFLSVPWARRSLWTISGAALWVSLEMLIARFLGGFPWNLLGSSQYRLVPLTQIASWAGIYGVSFLVIWFSLSLLCAGMVVLRTPAKRSVWVGEIMLPTLAILGAYITGYTTLMRPEQKTPQLTVALIQPSIPQSLIWDPNEDAHRFQQLVQISEEAAKNKPDLMIWPEAALPKMLRYDDDTLNAVAGLARSNKMWMIVGSDDAEPRRNPSTTNELDHFNCAFLISPTGLLMERYEKRNLVIFGEYIPFLRWLPFIKYLTPIDGVFTPGEKLVPFKLKDLNIKISTLICFEDGFPHLVREYVSDDTDFLVNITNDGWFGEGSAQSQQAANATFRAIENGLPLVRCSNNGLTCWIDARGRQRQIFESSSHGIYGAGFMIANIPVLAPGQLLAPTYYRRHGDVFGWACVAFTALQLFRLWSPALKRSQSAAV